MFRLVERARYRSQDKQPYVLADVNKRLEVAYGEIKEALSAKDTVLRQEKEEAEIWKKILAQIVEETVNGAAK